VEWKYKGIRKEVRQAGKEAFMELVERETNINRKLNSQTKEGDASGKNISSFFHRREIFGGMRFVNVIS